MNEEQLLQEARKEAEKVYPKLWDKLCIEAFINGYVANAKKRESEAVEFAEWLLRNTDFDEGEDKYQWYCDWDLYSSEEIYKLFKQQKQD